MKTNLRDFPRQLDSWRNVEDGTLTDRVVTWVGLDDWLLRQYRDEKDHSLWLYIGYIGSEDFRKGRDHHSPRVCYPGQGWLPVETGIQPIAFAGGQTIQIDRLVVQKGEEKRLVLYWFQWGDQIVAEGNWGDYGAKLAWLARLPSILLQNKRTDRIFIRISAPVSTTVEETLSRQIEFIQTVFPALEKHLAFSLSSV